MRQRLVFILMSTLIMCLPLLGHTGVLILKHDIYINNVSFINSGKEEGRPVYMFKGGASEEVFTIEKRHVDFFSPENNQPEGKTLIEPDALPAYLSLVNRLEKASAIQAETPKAQPLELPTLKTEAVSDTFPVASGFITRRVGMGGAFVSIADDLNSTFINPAGLVGVSNFQLGIASGFANVEYSGRILHYEEMYAVGMAIPVPGYQGSIGLSLSGNRISIQEYTWGLMNRYNYDYQSIAIAGGERIFDKINMGFSLISTTTSPLDIFQLGLQLGPYANWKIGLVYMGMPNLDLMGVYTNGVALGVNKLIIFDDHANFKINLAADLIIRPNIYIENSYQWGMKYGTELTLMKHFILRGGIGDGGLGFGLAYTIGFLSLEYSLVASAQYVSLNFSM